MKKLFTIALILLVTMTASAQGTWTTIDTPADELKGVKGGTHYKYSVEGLGEIEIYDWNDWLFKVTTYDGGFDFDEIKTKQVYNSDLSVRTVPLSTPKYKCNVLLGFYDKNEALKDKLELEMEVDQHQKCQNLTINKSWYFTLRLAGKLRNCLKLCEKVRDTYVSLPNVKRCLILTSRLRNNVYRREQNIIQEGERFSKRHALLDFLL